MPCSDPEACFTSKPCISAGPSHAAKGELWQLFGMGHFYYFTPQVLRGMIRNAGFDIVDMRLGRSDPHLRAKTGNHLLTEPCSQECGHEQKNRHHRLLRHHRPGASGGARRAGGHGCGAGPSTTMKAACLPSARPIPARSPLSLAMCVTNVGWKRCSQAWIPLFTRRPSSMFPPASFRLQRPSKQCARRHQRHRRRQGRAGGQGAVHQFRQGREPHQRHGHKQAHGRKAHERRPQADASSVIFSSTGSATCWDRMVPFFRFSCGRSPPAGP